MTDSEFPLAQVKRSSLGFKHYVRKYGTWYWLLTLVGVVVTLIMIIGVVTAPQPRIIVTFPHGHGLKQNDAVRYLGIEIGRVESINLDDNLEAVQVGIILHPEARSLARQGSQFWIERPQISLARIRGLETVVGANYVGVKPGPPDAPPQIVFRGLAASLALPDAPIEIRIHFRQGHGLAAGDYLKHRGIVVGEVTNVALDSDLQGVTVHVQMVDSARHLARAGSQFWVERPQLQLSEIRGLDTLVGGRYLAVAPGPAEGPTQNQFVGLEAPPALLEREEGGLEVILVSAERHGIEVGSPVYHRGVRVGRVLSVGLSSDAARVESRIYITPVFRRLVRVNTNFWPVSGVALSGGLIGGVQLNVESLTSLAKGGVSFATESMGKAASTGQRFDLTKESEVEGWQDWSPKLIVGGAFGPDNLRLPTPMRASVQWRERRLLGWSRLRSEEGWLTALEGRVLIGSANMLSLKTAAMDGRTILEARGATVDLDEAALGASDSLAWYRPSADFWKNKPDGANLNPQDEFWPRDAVRVPDEVEDCLLVLDANVEATPISEGSLKVKEGKWRFRTAMSFDETAQGAPVISRKDGALLGVLLLVEGEPIIAPFTKEFLQAILK